MSFHTIERFGAALTLSQCRGFNLGSGNPSLPTCNWIGNGGGNGGWPEFCPLRLEVGLIGGGGGGGVFDILIAPDGLNLASSAEFRIDSFGSKLMSVFDTLNAEFVSEGVVSVA